MFLKMEKMWKQCWLRVFSETFQSPAEENKNSNPFLAKELLQILSSKAKD